MKMEMRVLPFCGITAPRLPLEKSYSALMVFSFLSRRTTRRDRAVLAFALRPDQYKQFTGAPQSDGDEALFAFGVRVLNSDRERILKHTFRIGKRNPMFLRFAAAFAGSCLNRMVA
jgi:hypothetical protein